MWLLPAFSLISNAAARVYYRTTIAGEPVPKSGPVLLVANHPNSLFDPVLVVAAACRPVRFLAKAPLFADRTVGWLVRGVGSIPVYRRTDASGSMHRNVEMFRAVHEALEQGAAIGIFPEGISHSGPELAQLRTGAARSALGGAARRSGEFPIVPVGMLFRRKDVFRSEVLIVRGRPISWADLADRSSDDREAVRELTARIDAGMRQVTLNLERWEDRPLVEGAEAIWTAEWRADADPGPAHRLAQLELTTSILKGLRANPQGRWDELMGALSAHLRELKGLRLEPKDLAADVSVRAGLRWSVRRLHLVGLPALVAATLGYSLFLLPRYATGRLVAAVAPGEDLRATYKLLVGVLFYAVWIALLAVTVWSFAGYMAAALALVSMPLVGLVALWIRESWSRSWDAVRRFFFARSRRSLIETLKSRQRELAVRLRELQETFVSR